MKIDLVKTSKTAFSLIIIMYAMFSICLGQNFNITKWDGVDQNTFFVLSLIMIIIALLNENNGELHSEN